MTVALSISCKVEGDGAVQDVGQMVVGSIELPQMTLAGHPCATKITPLRVELERAHEKGVG